MKGKCKENQKQSVEKLQKKQFIKLTAQYH